MVLFALNIIGMCRLFDTKHNPLQQTIFYHILKLTVLPQSKSIKS